MKKIVIALVFAVLLIASAAIAVNAAELPDDYIVHTIEGMDRIYVTSSDCPDYKPQVNTSLVFDHLTDTGITFDLSESETKTVSLIAASRDNEVLKMFSGLFGGEDGTIIEIALFMSNDPSLEEWTPVNVYTLPKDGDWYVFFIDDLDEGYSFYRFDFEMTAGDSFTLKEFSLFKAADETSLPYKPDSKVVTEREPWRKTWALNGGSLLSMPGRMPR